VTIDPNLDVCDGPADIGVGLVVSSLSANEVGGLSTIACCPANACRGHRHGGEQFPDRLGNLRAHICRFMVQARN
jgi:hypothetical protein